MQIPFGRMADSTAAGERRSGLRLIAGQRGLGALAVALFVPWLLALLLLDTSTAEYAGVRISHVLYALAFAAYAATLLARRRLPGPTPVDAVGGALILVYAAAILLSPYRAIAFEASLFLVAGGLVFYLLHDFRALSVEAMLRAFVLGVSLLAAISLVKVGLRYAELYALLDVEGGASVGGLRSLSIPRSGGVYHPNVLALLVNLALPFAAAIALRPRRGFDRVLGVTALLVCLPALFFTMSRGGWLATLAGGAVFLLLVAAGSFRGDRYRSLVAFLTRRRRPLALGLIAGLAACALLAALLWGARDQLLFRDTLGLRGEMAVTALDIFAARPLLGSGPHTYGLLYESFGGQHGIEAVHPHNAYLLTLVDVGIAGALVYAAGLAVIACALVAGLRVADAATRLRLVAAGAALSAFLVHGLADSPFTWQVVPPALALVTAVVFRLSPLRIRLPALLSLASRLAVLALVPLLLVAWTLKDNANADYDAGLRALDEARYADAARLAAAAADAEPGSAAYQLNAGVTAALAQESADTTSAIAHLERAIENDPHSFLAYANLALLQLERGDTPAAVAVAEQALALAEGDPTTAILAGTVFEAAGREDEAVAAYAVAVEQDARLTQSPYWAANPQRLALRQRVIAAAGLDACEVGLPAALFGPVGDELGDLIAGCRELASATPADAERQVALALLLHASGDEDAARAALDAAERLAPDAASVHLARGVLVDDTPTARAELLQGGAQGRLLLARDYREAGEQVPAALLNDLEGRLYGFPLGARYYSQDLLREAPSVMLLPGAWQALESPLDAAIRALIEAEKDAAAGG